MNTSSLLTVIRSFALSVGLPAVFCASANAAAITWGPATGTTDPSVVSTNGILVEAVNASFTENVPGSATVNGVTFSNSDTLLPNNAVATDNLNGGSTGDAGLDALLTNTDFGGGTSTSITLGGTLSLGQPYELQVFFTDLRTCCNSRVQTYGDGLGNDVNLTAGLANFGENAIGTFTADGATQNLSLVTNGFGNAHITAYQIRAIPEPSAFALLALGSLIVFRRRR